MTDSSAEVRLVLSGRIVFQQDISVAQGAQVIGMLQAPSAPERLVPGPEPPALPAVPALMPGEARPEIPERDEIGPRGLIESPRQALELSGARTIPEKMTAFGAYLMQEEGRETFSQPDVRRLFPRARERIPTHFSREFDGAVRAGWILEGEAKGQFYLSEAARNVIEEGFGGLRAKRGRKSDGAGNVSRRTDRRKPRARPVPEVFADFDHIPAVIDGIPPFHQVKLKRDKLLWALRLAKDLGVEALQYSEAAWLTDKLGDGIPTRDMNGHFTGLRRSGFANRSMSDNAMRITPLGEQYLESL